MRRRRLAVLSVAITFIGIAYYFDWFRALFCLPVSQQGITETSSTG